MQHAEGLRSHGVSSQATRAYLHREEDVEAAFRAAGWKISRRELTAGKFYFSRLFEAVPAL